MRLLAVAACLLAWVCVAQAQAQMLEVAPVSVTLAPEQRTTSLTVTNRGTTAIVIQVRPFLWREMDGTATLTETAALAVSPPFAEVAPGQAQSIRLLLREPPGAAEETYRLFIDQIAAPAGPGIRMALRISLPVFAKPSVRTAAALVWQIVQSRQGAALEVQNRGNQHATIANARVSVPGGAALPVRTSAHPYVLAGATVQWPIGSARLPAGGPIRLTITSDTGVAETTASVVNGSP